MPSEDLVYFLYSVVRGYHLIFLWLLHFCVYFPCAFAMGTWLATYDLHFFRVIYYIPTGAVTARTSDLWHSYLTYMVSR